MGFPTPTSLWCALLAALLVESAVLTAAAGSWRIVCCPRPTVLGRIGGELACNASTRVVSAWAIGRASMIHGQRRRPANPGWFRTLGQQSTRCRVKGGPYPREDPLSALFSTQSDHREGQPRVLGVNRWVRASQSRADDTRVPRGRSSSSATTPRDSKSKNRTLPGHSPQHGLATEGARATSASCLVLRRRQQPPPTDRLYPSQWPTGRRHQRAPGPEAMGCRQPLRRT